MIEYNWWGFFVFLNQVFDTQFCGSVFACQWDTIKDTLNWDWLRSCAVASQNDIYFVKLKIIDKSYKNKEGYLH